MKKKIIIVVLVMASLAICGIGSYFLFFNKEETTPLPVIKEIDNFPDTSGMKIIHNPMTNTTITKYIAFKKSIFTPLIYHLGCLHVNQIRFTCKQLLVSLLLISFYLWW